MLRTIECRKCARKWFDSSSPEKPKIYQCPRCGTLTYIAPVNGQLRLEAFASSTTIIQLKTITPHSV